MFDFTIIYFIAAVTTCQLIASTRVDGRNTVQKLHDALYEAREGNETKIEEIAMLLSKRTLAERLFIRSDYVQAFDETLAETIKDVFKDKLLAELLYFSLLPEYHYEAHVLKNLIEARFSEDDDNEDRYPKLFEMLATRGKSIVHKIIVTYNNTFEPDFFSAFDATRNHDLIHFVSKLVNSNPLKHRSENETDDNLKQRTRKKIGELKRNIRLFFTPRPFIDFLFNSQPDLVENVLLEYSWLDQGQTMKERIDSEDLMDESQFTRTFSEIVDHYTSFYDMGYLALRLRKYLGRKPEVGRFFQTAASILLAKNIHDAGVELFETYAILFDRQISDDIKKMGGVSDLYKRTLFNLALPEKFKE